MGTWSVSLKESDTFLNIYGHFFSYYNKGDEPLEALSKVYDDFKDSFDDEDEKNDCYFALALASWETKILSSELYNKVKAIIDGGGDLDNWRLRGADEKTIAKRKVVLEKFLQKISVEKKMRKARPKPFDVHKYVNIKTTKIESPDGLKSVTINEVYSKEDNAYLNSGIWLEYKDNTEGFSSGMGFIYNSIKPVQAKWMDNLTLELTYDENIIIHGPTSCRLGKEDVEIIHKKLKCQD